MQTTTAETNSTLVERLVLSNAMDVFVLHHVHVFNDGEEDVKLIGVYSSETAASAAITRLREQPGFRDTPEGFTISRYLLDMDHWIEGYVTIDSADSA